MVVKARLAVSALLAVALCAGAAAVVEALTPADCQVGQYYCAQCAPPGRDGLPAKACAVCDPGYAPLNPALPNTCDLAPTCFDQTDGCALCIYPTSCALCYPDFLPTRDGKCTKVCRVPGCLRCAANNDRRCAACKPGFSVGATAIGSCVPDCSLDLGCSQCSGISGKCLGCRAGHRLDSASGECRLSCKPGLSGCRRCDRGGARCRRCDRRHELVIGRCIRK